MRGFTGKQRRADWASLRILLWSRGKCLCRLRREKFRFSGLSGEKREKLVEELRMLFEAHSEVELVVLFGSFIRNVPFRDVDLAVYVL